MSCCQTKQPVDTKFNIIEWLVNKEQNSQLRLQHCRQCEFINDLLQCQQCGCFMIIKTRIPQSSCPIGKW